MRTSFLKLMCVLALGLGHLLARDGWRLIVTFDDLSTLNNAGGQL